MNYHDYKQAQRQHCKPIPTHSEGRAAWFLAIAIGCGIAAAVIAWAS